MTPDERKFYAETIWTSFCLKAGKPEWQMGSADFDVIKDWADRGVPLRYILQGFETCKIGGKSLRYAVPAVEEEIKRARRALVF